MFLVKAGTVIQIEPPKSDVHYNWCVWIPYTTKEDKVYDKEEVWDHIDILYGKKDIPDWARHNIIEFNKVILKRAGKYAMVNPEDIKYLD